MEVANSQGRLAPGMFATVSVAASAKKSVLLVPSEAIIQTGMRSVVIVADMAQDGKQQFAPTDVGIGLEANGMTEIRRGLSKGMKVVLSGQFLIDSEASLKSTGTRMTEAPSGSEAHRGEGVVEKISKDNVTLSHAPIPSMQWGAMTMDFKLPASGMPANAAVGSQVTFEFAPGKDGTFEISSITPKAGSPGAKK